MPDTSGKIPFLPERIRGLERLSLNLLWRWHRPARALLRNRLDPVLWSALRHNPVALLRQMDPSRLTELAHDPEFLAELDEVMKDFDHGLASDRTWFRENFPEVGADPVAYFCAEFGLHNSIPIYSGGLGVLAGDHCKSASDLGVPFVGVGLMYHKGYFDQQLNLEGWQEGSEEEFNPDVMPLVRLTGADGSSSLAVVEMAGRDVHVGAWRVDVGRVRLFLLDTNLPENLPEDRELTYQLYGGGQEYRLRQEWILGVGGVRVLRALGVTPGAWHANEGHAAFMMVERLREEMAAGATLAEATDRVRRRTVFTTHTPVPAGHDHFPPSLLDKVCGDYHQGLGLNREEFAHLGAHPAEPGSGFHMTAAAIRLSAHVNGVSELHGRVSQEMWRTLWPGRDAAHVPIRGITNGVHLGNWMSHRVMELLDREVGPDWGHRGDDPAVWEAVLSLDDAAVWNAHLDLKQRLLDFCREESRTRWKTVWRDAAHLVGRGALLSPEPLTIGFARRFATYKRAHLIFMDEDRLARLLTDPRRPVQIVFAGKAHPADDEAKAILQRVWQATRDPRFEGRIAFVEDYEMHVAHRLVQGVDVWLNVPRVPMEASGTSGMKAGLNLVPQLSTLDGWWAEGFEGNNGWAIPRMEGPSDEVDRQDHDALFKVLEREVVPAFYDRDPDGVPRRFVSRMKHALRVCGSRFTSRRMVQDYARLFYAPALLNAVDDDPPAGTGVLETGVAREG
ncbi:MAG TPA: alpha-glucan family phosphorylase [Longimicrobiales bacterium]|nr:alpha-glucan family phosphorylase [Longimicrobiales bacterium]